ncbi:MAG: hypothetical protein ISP43_03505 [Candidatus Puniceispirillum sp.]|nr:hypothetical protein [Candidatus Puniceispirillum sp.]MBL6775019.1 hypothetical protein [Candidatus Puniceispirillum sp.]
MAPIPVAEASTSVERGREIVRQHCTRCHVIPGINPYGGIGSTPSFSAMKWLDDWARRFEIFYLLPPHPSLVRIEGVSEERSQSLPAFSKEIILKLEDVDDILEFVKTLKTPE